MLNYKPRNYEINTLYLAFSDLTKTIKVARDSLYEGDDNQALLNYHEVAQIFDNLNNQEKLGSCMNNLGCIYLKKDQFINSIDFLDHSISIGNDIIKFEKQKKDASEKDIMGILFLNACRQYNKGLSCKRYIEKIIKEYIPFHSLSQFVKKIPSKHAARNGRKGITPDAEIFA